MLGFADGISVETIVGLTDGDNVEPKVGEAVGEREGAIDGVRVG